MNKLKVGEGNSCKVGKKKGGKEAGFKEESGILERRERENNKKAKLKKSNYLSEKQNKNGNNETQTLNPRVLLTFPEGSNTHQVI